MMIAVAVLALLPAAAAPDEVLARVDADTITAKDLRARVTLQAGKRAPAQLLDDLIGEALLTQEGYRAGMANDAEVKRRLEIERRRLAADRFVAKEINPAAKVADARLLEMYHLTADSVKLEMVVRVTKEEAAGALERLRKGAKLSDEAQSSVDPDGKGHGGALGSRSRGQLAPPVAQAAFGATLGVFTGPIQLELGWAVIRVVERTVGDEAGFRAKRDQLRRFAELQAQAQLKAHYLQQLRKKSGVQVDEAFLKGTAGRLSGSADELSHVVATVGGHPVHYQDVVALVQRTFGPNAGGHATGTVVKVEFAWSIVDSLLLEDAAMERGFGKDPEVLAELHRLERMFVGQAYLARVAGGVAAPSAADVEGYYRDHAAEFRLPAHRRCWHVVAGSQDLAGKLRARILGGESFDSVARRFSLDESTAQAGGLIGDIGEDRIDVIGREGGEPALAAAIRNAKPGTPSEPVKSRLGWHVVKCDAPIAAGSRPLDQVKGGIADGLRLQRGEAAVRDRVAQLRGHARVTIDHAALQRAAH